MSTLFDDEIEDDDERCCRVCGCTDEQGCLIGCHWIDEDLCSTCERFCDRDPAPGEITP